MAMDNAQAHAVAVLIDELRSDDQQTRLASFKKLDYIAEALGPMRTREELIPYLGEFVDDDDEILLLLADALSKFLPYIGGPEYANFLFNPLETLSGMGEAAVRNKAVEAIKSVSDDLSAAALVTHMLPMVKRMATGDWFTSRISAANLCPIPYAKVNVECQREIRELFVNLCLDDTPMVRRAACSRMSAMINMMTYEDIKRELFPPFSTLAADEQDSVRLLAVQTCVDMMRVYKEHGCTVLFPVILGLCGDKSWRVRYMVADKFADIVTAVGSNEKNENSFSVLAEGFSKLLSDPEAEVRTAAAFKLGEVAKAFGPSKSTNQLLGSIKVLARDSCQYTRAALGSVVASISSVVRKQDVLDHLLPVFLQLLKDMDPEVRLNLISKIDAINDVIGVELMSQSLVPAIRNLAQDNNWRVRLSIIEHIPHLAKQLGVAFFEHQLVELSMVWLGDSVFTVREAATLNLTKLAEVFGVDWAKENIIPKVTDLGADNSYLFRITALFAIKDVSAILGEVLTTDKLLPVALSMATDPVPNVRFNVAKTLGIIVQHLSLSALDKDVMPLLGNLCSDSDADVRYFAEEALQKVRARATAC